MAYVDIANFIRQLNGTGPALSNNGTGADIGSIQTGAAPGPVPGQGQVAGGPNAQDDDEAAIYRRFEDKSKTMYPDSSEEERSANKRKRIIGLVASALLGGAMNRKDPAGGGAGAAAATQGFGAAYKNPIEEKNVQNAERRKESVKEMTGMWKERQKQKEHNLLQYMPDLVKNFYLTNNRMPNQMELVELHAQMNPQQKAGQGTDATKNYEYAKGNGFTGTFAEWVDRNKAETKTSDERNFGAAQKSGFKGTFVDFMDRYRSDPFFAASISLMNNDMGSMRLTPEQKATAAQGLAEKLRNQGAGAPVVRYDGRGNRIP